MPLLLIAPNILHSTDAYLVTLMHLALGGALEMFQQTPGTASREARIVRG